MSDVFIATDGGRRDAVDKLRGRTRYTIDRYLPGMLHAAVLRASVPSGRIVRLDVSRAARMPGVRAIVTAADAPGKIGIGIADHPLFARDLIRYDGEPLAAIAADTLIQARDALAAIDVEVEPLPAVLSMAEALAPKTPLVHPDSREHQILLAGGARAGNVAWEETVVRGDVDAAVARPDLVIVNSAFRVGRQNHVAFEPRAVVASYEDGRFHIETSTQVPWSIRNATARLLGVPASQVRVTVPPVGGGFGLKFDIAIEPFAPDRHRDEIAARIGMDPLPFRRRNVLGDGDLGATGQVFEGDVLGPTLDRMDTMRVAAAKPPERADGRLYGRATTVGTWFVFVGPSAATVNMNADGTATLVTSGVEIGSGSMMQGLPQIVAAPLGIAPEHVTVLAADTDAAGYDAGLARAPPTPSPPPPPLPAPPEVRNKPP